MNFPPFKSIQATLRVFLKALLGVFLINVVCLLTNFNPVFALTQVNLWGLVGHGRSRLIYTTDVANGQLPIEAMLAAHEIAYTPKAANEFRVLILGNSGPYGANLSDEETLSSLLNSRNIHINGKKLTAYNLAFPSTTVVMSAMILDAAAQYQPDLVISFLSANMFNNREGYWDDLFIFFSVNRNRLESIAARYGMTEWLSVRLSPRPDWYKWIAIRDQNLFPVWLGSLFYPFVKPVIQTTEWRIAADPIPDDPNNFEDVPGTYPIMNDVWQFLDVSQTIVEAAGARILFINQPMLTLDNPHSYSKLYGRAFYDAYYQSLNDYVDQKQLWYEDFWRVVPAENFTDSELHIDAAGWGMVADQLSRLITANNAS